VSVPFLLSGTINVVQAMYIFKLWNDLHAVDSRNADLEWEKMNELRQDSDSPGD